MKKTIKMVGITALVAVIGFTMAACSSPSGGGGGDPASRAFTISGSFSNSKTGNNSNFQLKSDAANSGLSMLRAVSSSSYAISGRLQDDQVIFLLKGTYDPITGGFIASAAATNFRYTIDGNVTTAGALQNATATLAVNNGSNIWDTFIFGVTPGTVDDIGNPTVIADTSNLIPDFAQGWWKGTGNSAGDSCLVSSTSFKNYWGDGGSTDTSNVVTVSGSGTEYIVIIAYKDYLTNSTVFEKSRFVFSSDFSKVTYYWTYNDNYFDGSFSDFASANSSSNWIPASYAGSYTR
ncbi:MAG: hypothetical protein LBH07_07150 [Treponema sp.]|jgi:hypothetical protein|nr:hypothetical protein [Treponema sp.]